VSVSAILAIASAMPTTPAMTKTEENSEVTENCITKFDICMLPDVIAVDIQRPSSRSTIRAKNPSISLIA
jgi:hypothetical protein